ncbi:benzoate 4-monooxygenase cytochrome P450 [Penicillium solitum]|uniref:benzoate 4-monooxygenase cytochrome P450 n=1 Tax=Penicillium solitum TaxID=60172 RepID=UPI0032C413F3|nr:benzoate 4-monooxygenase cytochrome P450 [Penicillium solitum]
MEGFGSFLGIAMPVVPYSMSYLSGRQPWEMLSLHKKYGSVVRVSPTELSFSTAQSWRDIYGTQRGRAGFIKSSFYDGGNFADKAHSIVSERDPEKHSMMRRFLSTAFSDRSLREQEGLITSTIDKFVQKVGEVGSHPQGVDLTNWFNLLTFDIIGDLAFGESFGGVDTGKTHPWISVVLESMGQASLSDTIQRFPWMGRLYMRLNPEWARRLIAGSIKHESNTMDLVKRRIASKSPRSDFMSYLLRERSEFDQEVSDTQLAAHASDFVIAGSETTATTLLVVAYYLSRYPEITRKLQKEVRSAFDSYEEINGSSTARLRYLHVICLEAMRMVPPLPLGLPRVVPKGGAMVDGHFVPEGVIVSTNPLAASLDPKNFEDPWTFDPDRWLQDGKEQFGEASQPFSLGSRSCLGRSLAWLEMRVTLAKLHFSYDFTPVNENIDLQQDLRMHLLWKKPELRFRVSPRK